MTKMKKSNNSLLIISGYINEKPTGGVTMHVHRLLKLLIEPKVPQFELCDYKKEGFRSQLKKIRRASVAHIHVSNPYLKLFFSVSGRIMNTKTVMTVHGRYGCYKSWKNFINKLALKICDVPVLINKESYVEVRSLNSDAVFIPAFLPPIKDEEKLSDDVQARIKEMKADGVPLFVTNASNRAYTDDGKEIYGIDFLIEFFKLKSEYKLLVLDPKSQYLPLWENKLPSNVSILTGLHSFCAATEMVDAVIRNTPTDGDSFSVKEALCYHKRILATDAVSRPEGVFLFKYNDVDSLNKAIEDALSFKGEINLKEVDSLEKHYQLYKQMGVC